MPTRKPWTPPTGLTFLPPRKHVPTRRVVTLPTGERVEISTDDSGTVTQIEHDHTLDAIVRPKTVTIQVRPKGAA